MYKNYCIIEITLAELMRVPYRIIAIANNYDYAGSRSIVIRESIFKKIPL